MLKERSFLSSFSEFGIEYIPEPFPKEVKGEDYDQNCDARYEGEPGSIKNEIFAV